ncbi:MAG: bifunctional 23S rRNA (guanine(2069)-N(7))-methyltransferase RlmK/23S rRNA (guanine(2445)-N(2))-methyltransferase RlmL [SAR86 cluster bacterium]|uniref:Bifunctional 23S rRNA (Guanine(2069)-N(7))-methyltransferase RlmK/23S rRNA (Guanine(2445)-N(2))-methyltransferase RlmL n=1 Tax=SAR86 cluster bacterium TaxID=2030880 RepID=A0A2A4MLI4_9GAMM|nr:MAG: bifunctional 23S rRNA (guanine(2069)-N(7))-methyltransferase RlmK/23S rRNA (guanine(2445)-N(2))-methyltransferase RlmL [SAR86 cluster bacterium]
MLEQSEQDEFEAGVNMLVNRLNKNLRKLGKWAKQQQLQCYRLYDADIPEYAFAIDLYKGRVHMQEYKAPASIPEQKVELRRQQAIAAVQRCLKIPLNEISLKTRQRQRGSNQYQSKADSGENFVVSEGQAKFWVNLRDYLDTGLFLDHQPIRQYIAEHARDKSFLNLFCYTGSASIQAALGGASSTLSIDLSNTYLDWARRNLQLNGLGGKHHQLKQKDCIEYLEKANGSFDMIFLDPPTFSNSKKTDNVLDIARDHVQLIKHAMGLLAAGGLLIFSTNMRKFKLDQDSLKSYALEDYTKASIGKDFARNPRIHQVWMIRHQT